VKRILTPLLALLLALALAQTAADEGINPPAGEEDVTYEENAIPEETELFDFDEAPDGIVLFELAPGASGLTLFDQPEDPYGFDWLFQPAIDQPAPEEAGPGYFENPDYQEQAPALDFNPFPFGAEVPVAGEGELPPWAQDALGPQPATPAAPPQAAPDRPAQTAPPERQDARPAPTTGRTTASALDAYLPPATLFGARLVTAAITPVGHTVPVLVEAAPDWCGAAAAPATADGAGEEDDAAAEDAPACPPLRLLGEAEYMTGGRLALKFRYAVLDGESAPIRAVGISAEDMGYGLKAQAIETAPNLTADLIRGSLAGISDWTDALLQSQQAYIAGDGVVGVSKSAPPLSAFLASRAADLLALPQDTKAVVRTYVVSAGEPLYVLVETANPAPDTLFGDYRDGERKPLTW